MERVRLAIAGVGNCASALVQGIEYYRNRDPASLVGLMRERIGCLRPSDIEPVAAFDVDRRKVGCALEDAVFAAPNCAKVFQPVLPASGVTVAMGPVLDGIADHMSEHAERDSFRVADSSPVDVGGVLRDTGAEVLVCYLPVGSEQAVRHYAQACLDAGVAMVNCVPVFLASDDMWASRFRSAGLPIVGDDIKSQVGATIVHRTLARLFADRGVELDRTYQLNTGGNTDFLNMLERSRLASKKRSKTESVQSQLDERLEADDIHIGPSDYVSWQGDNKLAFIRLEGRGFGELPIEVELRLSVQDSPNSAGVVIDAVRCARVALDRGLAGPLEAASACFMKSPPVQMRDEEARRAVSLFIEGRPHAIEECETRVGRGPLPSSGTSD
ncbi:MAG: inositol-3-phosphate synthase [Deltaproteobacteria bacterium]|nr:inositol-3-phosphate synthase [Deltaproteobacteria bacterium]